MSILLIVNEIPESIRMYLITDINSEEVKLLKLAHGKYLNGDELNAETDYAIGFIFAATQESSQPWDGVPADVFGKWNKYLMDMTTPPLLPINTRVVVTGMFC